MNHAKLAKLAPWVAAALGTVALAVVALPPRPVRGFDLDAFAHLPVLEGGRVKPIDSVARNTLLMIRGKQVLRVDDRTLSADEWLLDVLFRPQVADLQPVFFVDDPDVLGLVGLRQTTGRPALSFATLAPKINEIQAQAQAAQAIDAKQRTRFQSAVANLFDRLYLYYRLRNTVQLDGSAGLAAEIAARAAPDAARRQQALTQLAYFRPILPANPQGESWRTVGEALRDSREAVDPGLEQFARVGAAWAAQDAAAFDQAVAQLGATLTGPRPDAASKARQEVLFNRVEPFYLGLALYLVALLALFVSWIWLPGINQGAAFGFLCVAAVIHTVGLAYRVVLQGRPPVTNLYSSAVFVGWGAVIVGIVLERLYRRGFGTAVAAALGFGSLIVAHHLSGDGDTMEMMRAVLDSNFWLGTHVVTITIGYSAMFLAGAIAIGYTLRKHLARSLDEDTSKMLLSMTYGVICFALFFSFVGTVLGGIWADQSWGRFWGWDPKENGALLIVLWTAIILHARWGRYAGERGIMAMAIIGNAITSLSWFGVNMLGVGLHSYGFMDKAFWALTGFVASQLALAGLCMLPRRFWRPAAAPGARKAAARPA